jgi:hypothetical protein
MPIMLVEAVEKGGYGLDGRVEIYREHCSPRHTAEVELLQEAAKRLEGKLQRMQRQTTEEAIMSMCGLHALDDPKPCEDSSSEDRKPSVAVAIATVRCLRQGGEAPSPCSSGGRRGLVRPPVAGPLEALRSGRRRRG